MGTEIRVTCQAAATLPLPELADFQGNLKRISALNLERLKARIKRHGVNAPVFVWVYQGSNYILDGHQRVKALGALAEEGWVIPDIPVAFIEADSIEDARDKLLGISSQYGEFVLDEFESFVAGLELDDDLRLVDSEIALDRGGAHDAKQAASLSEQFMVPPFSVLNARGGWWVERKRAWLGLGIESEVGRGNGGDRTKNGLTYANSCQPPEVLSRKTRLEAQAGRSLTWEEFYQRDPEAARNNGTSIFDPVLCEIAYRWFSAPGNTVLDPFAGGSVRGIVAARTGREYIGVDLRAEQIEANERQADTILTDEEPRPVWKTGDSRNLPTITADAQADLVFTCPPYGDLEVYSDDPADLSAVGWSEFVTAYHEILDRAAAQLKDNRFAVVVVGEFRDGKGVYRGLIPETIRACEAAGLSFYNEAILVTQVGSLAMRAKTAFMKSRKLGKTHQNVLVFVKGDPVRATEAVGPVDIPDEVLAEAEEEAIA
ncbi:MAG: DNA methyltransferase [Alkalispirochaeta sp.]